MKIIMLYRLGKKLPKAVLNHIENGLSRNANETVKPGEDCLKKTNIHIVGSLILAARTAQEKAMELGFHTQILCTNLHGEAREKGAELAKDLKRIIDRGYALAKSVCLIAGGETTVTVQGTGKGGRNQETALSAAEVIKGLENCLFISLATDGEDGPTDAAGAAVDGYTIEKGTHLGMDAGDYLSRNDAYHFLKRTGSLIMTGPTGTNVNDLVIMFAFNSDLGNTV
jgi:glycerate 2-kinase